MAASIPEAQGVGSWDYPTPTLGSYASFCTC